jgi:hypothetical protein
MVPAAGLGFGPILKHRAGKTIFKFMAKTGVAMRSAQGILHTPARHVSFIICGADGFITSKLLPASVRHRSFRILCQRRESSLEKRIMGERGQSKQWSIKLQKSAFYNL